MTLKLVQRLDMIREKCRGKRVLHLGCADSPYTREALANKTLLHADLAAIASEVVGFDYDRDAIEILREQGFSDLHFADLEHLEDVQIEGNFDVIVAGEMIEHLNNPGLFLEGIKRFMSPETELIITTINAYAGIRWIRYSMTKGGGANEPVHPDHVAYYSYSTLRLLLRRHHLAVTDFLFYDLGREHRKTTPFIFRFLNDVSVLFARQLADGVIAVCRLTDGK